MVDLYSKPTISGYNSNPPPDDDSVTSDNAVSWNKHVNKLAGPIKTLLDSVNTGVDTLAGSLFGNSVTAQSANFNLATSDYGKLFKTSNAITITLLTGSDAGGNFVFAFYNSDSTNSLTLGRNGVNINGAASNLTIYPKTGGIAFSDGTDWWVLSGLSQDSVATISGNWTFSGTVTHAGLVTMSGKSIIEANASIAAHATTMDPWSLGNYVTLTGAAVTFTAMASAPQAGAEVELYMNAAHVFTDGAVFEVDGDANWTAEAGDRVLLRAKSTTVFTVHPRKKTGKDFREAPSVQAEVATTSGSSVTLASSIPSWVKSIAIGLKGVSTNGTAAIKIQIGDSGGLETTGYQGACWADGATTQLSDGFNIMPTAYVTAADTLSGLIILTRTNSATERWSSCGGTGRDSGAAGCQVVGYKELSAILTQIAIVTTDTFDAGTGSVTFLG